MADVIHCPSCQRRLQVPESIFGQAVQCPGCGATFTATNPSAPLASSPLAPAAPVLEPWRPPPAPREAPGQRQPPQRRQRHWDDRSRRPVDGDDDFLRPRRNYVADRGGVVLTLGIISLVACGIGVILGPIAWIMGQNDLEEMRRGRMDPRGESLTSAGRICGMLGTLLNLIGLVILMLIALTETRRFPF